MGTSTALAPFAVEFGTASATIKLTFCGSDSHCSGSFKCYFGVCAKFGELSWQICDGVQSVEQSCDGAHCSASWECTPGGQLAELAAHPICPLIGLAAGCPEGTSQEDGLMCYPPCP